MFIVIGTTVELSIRGCLAFFKLIYFVSLILGVIPFIELEYFAFAKIKSRLPIDSISAKSSLVYGKRSELKDCKILSISAVSSILKLFIALFASNTDIGSINTVEPLLEIS